MTGWDRKEVNSKKGIVNSDFTTTKSATKYLPKGTLWYDFWTGECFRGGRELTLQTTFDRVPMFVRAGSILPLGPEMQYVGEKAWDNLELRIYPGADATFTLYEDEGDNYNYEKGVYSTIPITWDNATHKLTIGQRQGSFPGMLQERQFVITLPDGNPQTVSYNGSATTIQL